MTNAVLLFSWLGLVVCVLIIRDDHLNRSFEGRGMTPVAFVFAIVFGFIAIPGTCLVLGELIGL
jgi:hypothetical protein